MEEKALIEILKSRTNLKLKNKSSNLEKANEIISRDFTLFHIEELTFEEKSPRKEAFENVLSSLRIEGVTFVYLLMGDKNGVHFYLGIARDKSYKQDLALDVKDIGKSILKASVEGNFRGSKIRIQGKDAKKDIQDKMSNMSSFAKISGVPNENIDSEDFQGVDRLVDVMAGDEFGLLILADPLSMTQIEDIENRLYNIYNKLSPLAKKSVQESNSVATTTGINSGTSSSKTSGESNSDSSTVTDGTSEGKNKSVNTGTGKSNTGSNASNSTSSGSTEGTSNGKSHSHTVGRTKGTSLSDTWGESTGKNESSSETKGNNISLEYSNKNVQEWLKYIDEVLLKRIDFGRSKGLFYTNIYLLANTKGTLIKLGNTIMSLFSGVEGNKVPLELSYIEKQSEIESLLNFQLPYGKLDISSNESDARLLLSQSINSSGGSRFGNWLSTNELSVITGLPQKEVVGLSLKEEVEFGLNPGSQGITKDNNLELGSLVRSGNILNIDVNINRDNLDKHTFIAGVTGSGKTTTCHRILESAKMPFMVIEPAKTEYRILTKLKEGVLIFTLGNDNVAPFRLNPFEFFPHENISSRVDMIKASIEAAFEMEAAIPQIIEAALYKSYEMYGWNISTNKNSKFADPFADGVYSFPTFSDLMEMTKVVVEEQGFDDRLKNDYIGSIKARLQGLLIGSKGSMLDTPRSIDFRELVRKNVILELEEIKSGNEKSLIMGFVLINLNEAVKANYVEDKKLGKVFKHITLIEEAHRLLTKFSPGDSPNKKQGVETFADMLAEVRKYGEALIIVDQIPNKLTSEVLKNTNTKIIHKLFAKDDKEAVGNTMALSDEQKDFLSYLEPGRAILSTQGLNKPMQVQIRQLDNLSTTTSDIISQKDLRNNVLAYYRDNYKRGIIQGLELLYSNKPSIDEVDKYLDFLRNKELIKTWTGVCKNSSKEIGNKLKEVIDRSGYAHNMDFFAKFLVSSLYKDSEDLSLSDIQEYLLAFLKEYISGKKNKFSLDDVNYLELGVK